MRTLPSLAFVTAIVSPLVAVAQPAPLDAAIAAYEDARFAEALERFAAAEEQADGLEAGDVESLFLYRALCHYALDDEDAFRAEVLKLAKLSPSYGLDTSVPPRVRDVFAELTAEGDPLTLEVTTHRAPHGVRVVAQVTGDPGGLVREIRMSGTTARGETVEASGAELRVPAASGDTIEYRAEVVGPGGAVIRRESGRSAPPTTETRSAVDVGAGGTHRDRDDGGAPLWPWLLGGSLIVAAAAVVIVLLATSSTGTRFGAPEVR